MTEAVSPLPTVAGARNWPQVHGVCPACGNKTLFLAHGGHVTCSVIDCPDPLLTAGILDGTDQYASVALESAEEARRAATRFAPMNSIHEGYAVILEELEEFWDECKRKPVKRDTVAMRLELVQVAAMAIRTIHDLLETR